MSSAPDKGGEHGDAGNGQASPPREGKSPYSQERDALLKGMPSQMMDEYRGILVKWFDMIPGAASIINTYFAAVGTLIPRQSAVNELMKFSSHNPFMPRPAQFHTPDVAKQMWKKNEALQAEHATAFSDKLWTHNSDGSLNHVTSSHILPYFKAGDSSKWPQLLLTTNHARTEHHEDISSMMDNFVALIDQTLRLHGGELKLIRDIKSPELKTDGNAIMVSAVRTEDTSYGNGAATIYRYNCLRDTKYTSLKQRMLPAADRFDDPVQARLSKPAPAAIRLAKLMLKLMVNEADAHDDPKNPDSNNRVNVDAVVPISEPEARFGRPMPTLRDDAAEVAKHITVLGYSMGAQTSCDSLRYLALELRAVIADKHPELEPIEVDMKVAEVMQHIRYIGANGPVVKMTDEERHLGMKRDIINSVNDLISYHFILDSFKGSATALWAASSGDRKRADRLSLVQGSDEEAGHCPDAALGRGDRQGYILKDNRARECLSETICSRFGIANDNFAARSVA